MHMPFYSIFTYEYVLYITQQNTTQHNARCLHVRAGLGTRCGICDASRDDKYNNCPLNLFSLEFANAFYSDVSGDGTDFQYVADNRQQLLVAKHVKAGAHESTASAFAALLSLFTGCSLLYVHCSYDNEYVET